MSDFLIIDGGIAGVSLAAKLAPLGSVHLVEGESHLAYHASGRSAALYEPKYGPPAIVALSEASDVELRGAGVLSPRGLMLVAGTEDMASFDGEITALGLDPITVDEARRLVPILSADAVRAVAYSERAWDIDTDRLVQGYARAARDQGATIETGAQVTAIRRDAQGWVVGTAKGDRQAKVLINAAGAWVDQVAAMAGAAPLGFTPMRRSMARIPAPDGHDIAGWPMMFGSGEGWYAKPDAGALIVSPAEEHGMDPHDAWADDLVLAEGLARYETMVTVPVTRLVASWAGLRTFSPDRAPVFGPDASVPNLFWCAGQGGYGFQSAPGASSFLADLIAGRAPGYDAAFVKSVSPERFA